VARYHQMIAAGLLTEDDKLELLEGWLVEKQDKSPRHSFSRQQTRECLAGMIAHGWYADTQESITTADSEPEPDISVVRGERHDYADHHPSPDDIALVVEVADSTLARDRTLKLRIYARAGIPVYWIINLPERQIEVYSEPAGEVYARRLIYTDAQDLPVSIGGAVVGHLRVAELLG
jgi:hypothetical protein